MKRSYFIRKDILVILCICATTYLYLDALFKTAFNIYELFFYVPYAKYSFIDSLKQLVMSILLFTLTIVASYVRAD